MGKKCIGVDVGGTSVKLGLFEVTGELLKKWEVPTNKEEQGKCTSKRSLWFLMGAKGS